MRTFVAFMVSPLVAVYLMLLPTVGPVNSLLQAPTLLPFAYAIIIFYGIPYYLFAKWVDWSRWWSFSAPPSIVCFLILILVMLYGPQYRELEIFGGAAVENGKVTNFGYIEITKTATILSVSIFVMALVFWFIAIKKRKSNRSEASPQPHH